MKIAAGTVLRASGSAYQDLVKAPPDAPVVRAPILSDTPGGKTLEAVSPQKSRPIGRADPAVFMLDCLTEDRWIGTTRLRDIRHRIHAVTRSDTMRTKERLEGLFELSFGFVSAYILAGEDDLTLIDTGMPGRTSQVLEAIERIGGGTKPLMQILVTHLHLDHVGSLADLAKETGAKVYAHMNEADAIEAGTTLRSARPAPTLKSRLMVKLISRGGGGTKLAGTHVDQRLQGGEDLPFAGGIRAEYTPGHTAGHTVYLWSAHGGVLFAGDAASGGRNPGYPMLFEEPDRGQESLERLGTLTFDKAFFAHGRPILADAGGRFARAWAASSGGRPTW